MTVSSVTERGSATKVAPAPDPRRWTALWIIAVAQLMVVLDATIVNIALPHAQSALGISEVNKQWVVTAYTLTFGGLLLLGGRIADYWGRKRTFMVGIVGFALASALGGIAQNGETLFAARALQGAFGALLAPASLALLTVLFTDTKERAKAFGVYGAIAGGGAAVGLLLGGALTEWANWRWCLLVNIPIALVAAAFAYVRLGESNHFWSTTLPATLVIGAGLGLIFVPLGNVALNGVNPHDAGAAGAMVSATQQVGGSVGVALLTSVSVSAANSYFSSHAPAAATKAAVDAFTNAGLVHSFHVGFTWAAAFMVVAGMVVLALVKNGKVDAVDGVAVHIG